MLVSQSAALAISIVFLIGPFVESLNSAHDALCGGHLDFIVTTDALGMPFSVPTNPYGKNPEIWSAFTMEGIKVAVKEGFEIAKKRGAVAEIAPPNSAPKDPITGEVIQTLGSRYASLLLNVKKPSFTTIGQISLHWGSKVSPEAIAAHLRWIMQNDTFTCKDLIHKTGSPSCFRHPDNPAELSQRLQALCPEECGCFSPFTGTLFPVWGGCPSTDSFPPKYALDLYTKAMAGKPCEDPNSTWNRHIIEDFLKLPEVLAAPEKYGQLHPVQDDWCQLAVRTVKGKTTIPSICPIAYGCLSRHDWRCPPSCFAE